MEEEGIMIPSQSIVSTFRNSNVIVPNFPSMNTPYHNVFHAALNPSIQMYPPPPPPLESHHHRDVLPRNMEGDSIEMTTFPVSNDL